MRRDAPAGLWPFRGEAAIFDFDGTLADTAHIWREVDLEFLARRGLPYTADYPQRLAALGFEDGAKYTIERFGLHETVEEICDEWNRLGRQLYRNTVTLRPGALHYIQTLKSAGIPCALATTNNKDVLGGMRRVNVYEVFDACVHGADVGKGKDHPDIYLEAARRLRVEPEACVVFEDIVPALHSARRAGMRACGVRANDPNQIVEETKKAADCWLDDWRDITYGGKLK